MQRRNFIKNSALLSLAPATLNQFSPLIKNEKDDRSYWIETMLKIAGPVMEAVASQKLKATMPTDAGKLPTWKPSVGCIRAWPHGLNSAKMLQKKANSGKNMQT